MFSFRDSRGSVEVAFTDRRPGDGKSRDGPLDLAEPTAGSPGRVSELAALERNLDILGHALARGVCAPRVDPLGLPPGVSTPTIVRMHQVHGSDVHTVEQAWLGSRPEPPSVDGMVTPVPGVALLVRAADCVPVLLADVDRRVVGAAHAGRRGLLAGIVANTINRMRYLGAQRITGWLGPSICGRCYEVPATMREEAAAAVPESYAETSWGTPAVDVAGGVLAQLRAAEVDVVDASRCTLESEDLFSYRRQGAAAGRLGGVIWVRP